MTFRDKVPGPSRVKGLGTGMVAVAIAAVIGVIAPVSKASAGDDPVRQLVGHRGQRHYRQRRGRQLQRLSDRPAGGADNHRQGGAL